MSLGLGEHKRRSEPDPIRHGSVDQEPGFPSGSDDSGCDRGAQPDSNEQARCGDRLHKRVTCRGHLGGDFLTKPGGVVN